MGVEPIKVCKICHFDKNIKLFRIYKRDSSGILSCSDRLLCDDCIEKTEYYLRVAIGLVKDD